MTELGIACFLLGAYQEDGLWGRTFVDAYEQDRRGRWYIEVGWHDLVVELHRLTIRKAR